MARRDDAGSGGASSLCMILEARRPERLRQLATNDMTLSGATLRTEACVEPEARSPGHCR